MQTRSENGLSRLSLARQFMIASLIILVVAALALGEWVVRQIEDSVVHRTAETTALFVDSFISPNLQDLAATDALAPENVAALSRLLEDTPLGQHIVSFKVWDPSGKVVYSADPAQIGQVFPVAEGLAGALGGEVSSHISDLEKEENTLERAQESQLLETYSPVRETGTGRVIGAAEFYQSVEDLQGDIAVAQRRSWLVVGLAMGLIYLLLAGFVGRASDTIDDQRAALRLQVSQLTDLLAENRALSERVRRAAARTTALNERVLRRISADLHDGPVQDLGLALLRLDHVAARVPAGAAANGAAVEKDLDVVQDSLQRALADIRALSAGLGVPHLNELTLPETVSRAVRIHEQRSGTAVEVEMDGVPERASLPVKITVFRLVQEALNNAYRHAGGAGQRVAVTGRDGQLRVEIADSGPGFGAQESGAWEQHLGLAGMRERIESLGGSFRVESEPGRGTRVIADLALPAGEESYG